MASSFLYQDPVYRTTETRPYSHWARGVNMLIPAVSAELITVARLLVCDQSGPRVHTRVMALRHGSEVIARFLSDFVLE